MNTLKTATIAMALAAFSVGTVYAQSAGSSGGSGGGKTESTTTFQEWLNAHSAKNNGRVQRQAYMDEMGRRWDTMDKNKQGLTMAEVRGFSGPPAVMGGPTSTNTQDKKGIKQ